MLCTRNLTLLRKLQTLVDPLGPSPNSREVQRDYTGQSSVSSPSQEQKSPAEVLRAVLLFECERLNIDANTYLREMHAPGFSF